MTDTQSLQQRPDFDYAECDAAFEREFSDHDAIEIGTFFSDALEGFRSAWRNRTAALAKLEERIEELELNVMQAENQRDMYQKQRADWKAAHDQMVEKHAALQSRLAAYEKQQWQPIETAPKDGSYILLSGCTSGADVVVGHWGNGTWNRSTKEYEKCWVSGYGAGSECDPKVWMPLPARPTEGKENV